MIQLRPVLIGLVLVLAFTCLAWAVARGGDLLPSPRPLRLATWNMEWLLAPATAHAARLACRDGRASPVPCDVARSQARDSADLMRMSAVVKRLDADVIAFQEVEDEEIAARVFDGYRICMAAGPGVQHAGFAVRSRLRFRCEAPLASLGVGGRGRAGQVITLYPPGGAPIELLAVHLKSGCARDPLDSPSAACVLLARQAEALGEWIASRARADTAFVVLGDLNRQGTAASDPAFWSLLHSETFAIAADHLPYRNCVPGAPYEKFIDHILVSTALVPQLSPEGFRQLRYRAGETLQYRLSDHCPVSVSISANPSL